MSEDLRNEIIREIAKTNDVGMKAVLLLMLKVVSDISDKIDTLMDEKGLRDAVLNGHEQDHDAHHEWVARKIQEELDDAAAAKQSKRNIRDELLINVLKWAAVTVLVASGWVFR